MESFTKQKYSDATRKPHNLVPQNYERLLLFDTANKSFAIGRTFSDFIHRIPHQLNIQISHMTNTAPPQLSPSAICRPLLVIHLSILIQNLLQPRFVVALKLLISFRFYFDLEAQVCHRDPFDVLRGGLLIDFELHFVDFLDMVDWHQGFAVIVWLIVHGRRYFPRGTSKEIVVYWSLLLAQFLLHVHQSVIVHVFGVAAVLVFGTGVFVDLVIYKIAGDRSLLIVVETAAHWRNLHQFYYRAILGSLS